MNAPTLPLLDEQTEQELAPPCEARTQCTDPAGWVTRFQSDCGHVPAVALCCTRHASIIAAKALRGLVCAVCSTPVSVTGIEPL